MTESERAMVLRRLEEEGIIAVAPDTAMLALLRQEVFERVVSDAQRAVAEELDTLRESSEDEAWKSYARASEAVLVRIDRRAAGARERARRRRELRKASREARREVTLNVLILQIAERVRPGTLAQITRACLPRIRA